MLKTRVCWIDVMSFLPTLHSQMSSLKQQAFVKKVLEKKNRLRIVPLSAKETQQVLLYCKRVVMSDEIKLRSIYALKFFCLHELTKCVSSNGSFIRQRSFFVNRNCQLALTGINSCLLFLGT